MPCPSAAAREWSSSPVRVQLHSATRVFKNTSARHHPLHHAPAHFIGLPYSGRLGWSGAVFGRRGPGRLVRSSRFGTVWRALLAFRHRCGVRGARTEHQRHARHAESVGGPLSRDGVMRARLGGQHCSARHGFGRAVFADRQIVGMCSAARCLRVCAPRFALFASTVFSIGVRMLTPCFDRELLADT